MERGAWWATVHRVTKSQTGLKRLSAHACKQEQTIQEIKNWKKIQEIDETQSQFFEKIDTVNKPLS